MKLLKHDTQLDVSSYDYVLCETSGGKDSGVLLHLMAQQTKVIAVHAAIPGFDWPDSLEHVRRQAGFCGVELIVCKSDRTIFDRARFRRMWPGWRVRWCTKEFKVHPLQKLVRSLCKNGRVLICRGERAEESDARLMRMEFDVDMVLTTMLRDVDIYRPLLWWSENDVWTYTKKHGIPVHRCYSLGFSRLGCPYCIFNRKEELDLADSLPELSPMREEIRKVEAETGHLLHRNQ